MLDSFVAVQSIDCSFHECPSAPQLSNLLAWRRKGLSEESDMRCEWKQERQKFAVGDRREQEPECDLTAQRRDS